MLRKEDRGAPKVGNHLVILNGGYWATVGFWALLLGEAHAGITYSS